MLWGPFKIYTVDVVRDSWWLSFLVDEPCSQHATLLDWELARVCARESKIQLSVGQTWVSFNRPHVTFVWRTLCRCATFCHLVWGSLGTCVIWKDWRNHTRIGDVFDGFAWQRVLSYTDVAVIWKLQVDGFDDWVADLRPLNDEKKFHCWTWRLENRCRIDIVCYCEQLNIEIVLDGGIFRQIDKPTRLSSKPCSLGSVLYLG